MVSLLCKGQSLTDSPQELHRECIKFDLLYDTLSFSINKAFTWSDILRIFLFTSDFFTANIGLLKPICDHVI